MNAIQAFVGLDVHKSKIVVAVAMASGGEPQLVGTIPHDMQRLLKLLERIGPRDALQCCYEAGPTGFGACRALLANNVLCDVIAPSSVPKGSGPRIKTDRRDARTLAQCLRAGLLSAVLVPDPETEAIRDLERARRDASRALLVSKQQLGAFLLRQDRRFPGKTQWTHAHFQWLGLQRFEHPAQQAVFTDALRTVISNGERVAELDRQLEPNVRAWSRYPLVHALQALRGVQLLTATTLVAEIVDFDRFATPRKLMGYIGMVPREESSGDTVRRGAITRAGNSSVRRVITEATWAYLAKPRMSKAITKRSQAVAHGVKEIAWKAQQRLHHRLWALINRSKNKNKAAVAVGRELLGFIWAIAHEKQLLADPTPAVAVAS